MATVSVKTVPVVFVAVMALAASVRSQVTDGVDSREPTAIPVTGDPDGNNRLPEFVCDTAAHEFGHVMGLQHPDAGGAPAPLIGSPRLERLMYSEHGTVHGNRLIKAEWDEIEKWMKKNKDNKQP